MAKAEVIITCRVCGKEFRKFTTKSSRREADSWEEWAKENIDTCDECRREEEKKQREKDAEDRGWPELSGTEKQVAWANKIRADFMRTIQDAVNKEFLKFITETVTTAREWIDRRDDHDLVEKMYRRYELWKKEQENWTKEWHRRSDTTGREEVMTWTLWETSLRSCTTSGGATRGSRSTSGWTRTRY